MSEPADSVAIVTGSAGGIGRSICEQFARRGYRTIGIDRVDSDTGSLGTMHEAVIMDVSDSDSLHLAFDCVEFGRHNNVLVNCAGIREICHASEISLSLWNEVFSINVTAPFLLSQEFYKRLVREGKPGNIVNVASVSGLLAEPNRAAYVSSKHALLGLTKQLAIEFGTDGIRVNAVAPGVIRTQLTEAYYTDDLVLSRIRQGQFLDSTGEPSDVARAVTFLSEADARFTTGTTIVVDGGWSAGKSL